MLIIPPTNLATLRASAMHREDSPGLSEGGIRKIREQWRPSPNSPLVTPLDEFPRFPSPHPVSPTLIKGFAGLNSSFGVRGFAQDAFELLILRLAPHLHEASPVISISVNGPA